MIGAEIDLDDCIDLLDMQWQAVLRESYADLLERLARSAEPIPRQTTGAHRLDRAVINHTAGLLKSRGRPARTVRAAFAQGEPLFSGSGLWSLAHIQIAVRDQTAIDRMWRAA